MISISRSEIKIYNDTISSFKQKASSKNFSFGITHTSKARMKELCPPPPPSIPSSKKILMTFPLPYLRLFEVGALSRLSSERAYKIFTIFSHIFSVSLLSINKTKKKNTVLTLYRVFTIFSFFLVWGVLWGGGGGVVTRGWALINFRSSWWALIRTNAVCL